MKVILAIESSNTRGMGHLFRSLYYVDWLDKNMINYAYLINNDEKSLRILDEKQIKYSVVDYEDKTTDWETQIIYDEHPTVWLNDKFETSEELARHVIKNRILFSTIDDIGNGACLADIYFSGTVFWTLGKGLGKINYCGDKYVTINPEVDRFKRKREKLNRILVTLGGSDPHGVTVEVVEELQKYEYDVTIVIGPNFNRTEYLQKINTRGFKILQNVPSLIELMYDYDLAITGGGITCCEATAAGLPCMIIANASHEINTGKHMEQCAGSIYMGSYDAWDKKRIGTISQLDVAKMSSMGLGTLDTKAVERIFKILTNISDV